MSLNQILQSFTKALNIKTDDIFNKAAEETTSILEQAKTEAKDANEKGISDLADALKIYFENREKGGEISTVDNSVKQGLPINETAQNLAQIIAELDPSEVKKIKTSVVGQSFEDSSKALIKTLTGTKTNSKNKDYIKDILIQDVQKLANQLKGSSFSKVDGWAKSILKNIFNVDNLKSVETASIPKIKSEHKTALLFVKKAIQEKLDTGNGQNLWGNDNKGKTNLEELARDLDKTIPTELLEIFVDIDQNNKTDISKGIDISNGIFSDDRGPFISQLAKLSLTLGQDTNGFEDTMGGSGKNNFYSQIIADAQIRLLDIQVNKFFHQINFDNGNKMGINKLRLLNRFVKETKKLKKQILGDLDENIDASKKTVDVSAASSSQESLETVSKNFNENFNELQFKIYNKLILSLTKEFKSEFNDLKTKIINSPEDEIKDKDLEALDHICSETEQLITEYRDLLINENTERQINKNSFEDAKNLMDLVKYKDLDLLATQVEAINYRDEAIGRKLHKVDEFNTYETKEKLKNEQTKLQERKNALKSRYSDLANNNLDKNEPSYKTRIETLNKLFKYDFESLYPDLTPDDPVKVLDFDTWVDVSAQRGFSGRNQISFDIDRAVKLTLDYSSMPLSFIYGEGRIITDVSPIKRNQGQEKLYKITYKSQNDIDKGSEKNILIKENELKGFLAKKFNVHI